MSALGTEVPTTQGARHWTKRMPERLRRGSAHPAAKLTESAVRAIRQLYADKMAPMEWLAVCYGVHRETISRIVRRETWRHL